jgi:hypothetical protein
MIRSLAATLFALVMMGGLAVSAQADSIPTSGTVTGNSTLTATASPFVFDTNFTGSGVDTVSGNFTATNIGTTTFNSTFTSFTASGTFIDVFAGGTVFGTFTENGTVTGNTSTINVHSVTTGGTGMFLGDTGESIVTGTNTTTSSPMFTGTYTGFINTVPEPSSLALMLAGIGLLPLMRKRLARGRQAT